MTASPQALEAFALANERRLARAVIRREVIALDHRAGRERVAELLGDPPPELGGASIAMVLCWIHRVGPRQTRRWLTSLSMPVSELRQVRELTERQRREIAGRLRAGGAL